MTASDRSSRESSAAADWVSIVAVWAITVLILVPPLASLLHGAMLASWELPALFRLALSMPHRFFAAYFDPLWNCGSYAESIPVPGFLALTQLPHLLSAGGLSALSSFNLIVLLTPFVWCAGLWSLARRIGGNKLAVATLIFAGLFLALPKDFMVYQFSLSALLRIGCAPQILAAGLLALCASIIPLSFNASGWRLLSVVAGIALLFLIEPAIGWCGVWFAACYLALCDRTPLNVWLTILAGVVLLLIPVAVFGLWSPFPKHISVEYLPHWKESDPLLALFPEFTAARVLEIYRAAGLAWSSAEVQGPIWQIILCVVATLRALPYLAILALLSLYMGASALCNQRRYALPACLLLTILFIPREYLEALTSYQLGGYRSMPAVIIPFLLLCAFGVTTVANYGEIRRARPVIIAALIVLAYVTGVARLRPWDAPSPATDLVQAPLLKDAPHRAAAEELMSELAQLKPQGRVAVQRTALNNQHLGSTHFFSVYLPARYGIPVVTAPFSATGGTAEWVDPLLGSTGTHIFAAPSKLAARGDFRKLQASDLVQRLGTFNTQFIVTSGQAYRNILKGLPPEELTLVSERGPFALFRLTHFRPRIAAVSGKPALYVDRGGPSFEQFARAWFADNSLQRRLLLRAPESLSAIKPELLVQLGAVIISVPEIGNSSAVLDQVLLPPGVQLITIRGSRRDELYIEPQTAAMISSAVDPASLSTIRKLVEGPDYLKFTAVGPTLVNYSYSPRWRSEQGAIFEVAPNMMLIFATGDISMQVRQ